MARLSCVRHRAALFLLDPTREGLISEVTAYTDDRGNESARTLAFNGKLSPNAAVFTGPSPPLSAKDVLLCPQRSRQRHPRWERQDQVSPGKHPPLTQCPFLSDRPSYLLRGRNGPTASGSSICKRAGWLCPEVLGPFKALGNLRLKHLG